MKRLFALVSLPSVARYHTSTICLAPKKSIKKGNKQNHILHSEAVSSSKPTGVRLADLVHTQDALLAAIKNEKKVKLEKKQISDFAHFFRLSSAKLPNTDRHTNKNKKSVAEGDQPIRSEDDVQHYLSSVLEQLGKEEKVEVFKRNTNGVENEANFVKTDDNTSSLEIFFASVSKAEDVIFIFSVKQDAIVLEVPLPKNNKKSKNNNKDWLFADEMIKVLNGAREFILIPAIDETEKSDEKKWQKERMHVRTLIETHICAPLHSSGLLPVTGVDSYDLRHALVLSPTSLTGVKGKQKNEKAAQETFLRGCWQNIRTLAFSSEVGNATEKLVKKGGPPTTVRDPLQLIGDFVLPRFDVFVIHLVRAGSRSMNLSVWHVQRQKRYHAKGMLSDIIGGLIQSHARRIIFLPTNRTDRRLLFSCRAALLKTGCLCTVVYASDLSEQFRGNYQSDPSRYWTSLKEDGRVLDADLLLHIYQAAGVTLRASHKTYLLESGKVKEEDTKPLQEEDALVCRTDVEEWLAPLRSPARVAAEEAQLQQYTKYLVIGYTTTEHTAHGQPNCATAAVNYVIATAMMDDEGHTLLPWVYHEARGELRLPSLDRYDVLVLHGAKRFLLFCWQDPELVRFLRRGGRVWCTQQAEYILEAQRVKSGGNQLENVALKYGFHTPPSSVIGQTKEELPFSFHRRFLVEAVTATRGVFQGQLTKAVRQSQLLCAAHRMDALLAMTAMEYSGIFIDIKEAERQSLVLQNSASVIDQALQAYVPTEVPQDMRLSFDWTSVTVMHAYLFGGKITIGLTTSARTKWSWLNNLVHLCFRFGHWDQLSSEVHLRRYVALSGLEATSNVTKRIGEHLVQQNSSKKKYRLVLFDIETTGLNPATDAVIEVALYDPVSNNSFTSLVNPQRPITPRTTEIHKITNAAVKGAPTIDVVGKSVAKFLKLDAKSYNENEVLVLVGHNVFSIDEPMLRRAVAPHVSQEAGDGVLYCDSLAMLRALKMQLQHSRMVGSRKKNKDVLEKLTSSLRLGDLIKNLNIVPEGSLHRADTDTRALWYVLVNAYGLGGKSPSEQVQHLLKEAANTLVTFPSTGCFVPTDRRQQALQVLLPGVASDTIKNQKLLHSLEKQPLSDTVLKTLKGHGLKVADLLLRRMQLDQYAFRFFHSDSKTLNVIHDDHTVHQLIDTTSSNTSRTVSAYPSCQNIPKDDKSSVRRLFASRFGAMGRCIEIDYSQLEIYVLAVLCNDENLTRDLKNGVDFHIKRAAFFSGLSYEEIEKGYKKGDPRFVKLRKTAKQFSFQRLYGAGVPLLHKTTGISVKDLTASIAAEDKEYPGIAAFHRMTRSVALRPNNPGLPTGFVVEMPTGLRMHLKTRDVTLNLPPLKNYPIQGYGAELAQMMVGRVFRHLCENNFYQQKVHLTNFVHDSVWLDCHVSVLEKCVTEVCRILCEIHEYVPHTFPGTRVEIPFQVSASCGLDMCSMTTIKNNKDFSFVASQKKSKMEESIALPNEEEHMTEVHEEVEATEGGILHL